MRKSIILIVALIASLNISAQTKEKQDSLNIPVSYTRFTSHRFNI